MQYLESRTRELTADTTIKHFFLFGLTGYQDRSSDVRKKTPYSFPITRFMRWEEGVPTVCYMVEAENFHHFIPKAEAFVIHVPQQKDGMSLRMNHRGQTIEYLGSLIRVPPLEAEKRVEWFHNTDRNLWFVFSEIPFKVESVTK